MGVILTTYDTWGDAPSKTPWKIPWCRVSTQLLDLNGQNMPGRKSAFAPNRRKMERMRRLTAPETCCGMFLEIYGQASNFMGFLFKKSTSRWFWGSLIVTFYHNLRLAGGDDVITLPYLNPTDLEIHTHTHTDPRQSFQSELGN